MGEAVKVTGMVLSAMPVGDYDKRLVILTRERGKISAFSKGARRQNSPIMAGSRPFSFGEFMLYEGRSSYTVSSMEISNYFTQLGSDLIGACYGFYFLEFADYYGRENVDESQMIKLLYQTFRALMNEKLDKELVRRIFELKAMTLNGEYPQMFSCTGCKREERLSHFSVKKGGMVCRECAHMAPDAILLEEAAVYTMQYVIASPIEKLFTFTVSPEVLTLFGMALDRHKAFYIDKKMKSLEILKTIL